jgi:hypothetical protein
MEEKEDYDASDLIEPEKESITEENPHAQTSAPAHTPPYTLANFNAMKHSEPRKASKIIKLMKRFIFKVGGEFYVAKLNENGFVEFVQYSLNGVKDLLFTDTKIYKTDEKGEIIKSPNHRSVKDVMIPIIRKMTTENDNKGKKERLTKTELKTILEDIQKEKENEFMEPVIESTNYFQIFKSAACQDALKKFDTAALFTKNPRILQIFTPPTPEFSINPLIYERQTAIDYINLVLDANVYKNPVHDFFKSIAYYLRNPDKKPCRWFIRYSPKEEGGETGKSFLDGIIYKMLNHLAMVNCTPELLENDRFNEYDERYLFCSINETQADSKRHYEANKIARIIKSATDPEGEVRGMHKAARSGKKLPLWNLNTNEADLHGIAYMTNDKALMSRLSITVWKKQIKTKAEMEEIDNKFLYNPNMAYSLYKYLTEEYDITEYSPKRTDDPEKEEILKMLKAKNKSPLQEFVEYLEYYDETRKISPDETNYWIIHRYEAASSYAQGKYEYVKESEFKRELKREKNITINADKLKSEMLGFGWDYGQKKIKGKNERVFYREPEHGADLMDDTPDEDAF